MADCFSDFALSTRVSKTNTIIVFHDALSPSITGVRRSMNPTQIINAFFLFTLMEVVTLPTPERRTWALNKNSLNRGLSMSGVAIVRLKNINHKVKSASLLMFSVLARTLIVVRQVTNWLQYKINQSARN